MSNIVGEPPELIVKRNVRKSKKGDEPIQDVDEDLQVNNFFKNKRTIL